MAIFQRSSAATTDYFAAAAPVTAPPFTIAVWAFIPTGTGPGIAGLTSSDGVTVFHGLSANPLLQIWALSKNGANSASAPTSSAIRNRWLLLVGVWVSTSDRSLTVNGRAFTSPTNIATGTITDLRIGLGWYTTGSVSANDVALAHLAVWNTNLRQVEHFALARGFLPYEVRPDNLVAYYPMTAPSSPVGLASPSVTTLINEAPKTRGSYNASRVGSDIWRYTHFPDTLLPSPHRRRPRRIAFSSGASTYNETGAVGGTLGTVGQGTTAANPASALGNAPGLAAAATGLAAPLVALGGKSGPSGQVTATSAPTGSVGALGGMAGALAVSGALTGSVGLTGALGGSVGLTVGYTGSVGLVGALGALEWASGGPGAALGAFAGLAGVQLGGIDETGQIGVTGGLAGWVGQEGQADAMVGTSAGVAGAVQAEVSPASALGSTPALAAVTTGGVQESGALGLGAGLAGSVTGEMAPLVGMGALAGLGASLIVIGEGIRLVAIPGEVAAWTLTGRKDIAATLTGEVTAWAIAGVFPEGATIRGDDQTQTEIGGSA